jgi:hypothetical protein
MMKNIRIGFALGIFLLSSLVYAASATVDSAGEGASKAMAEAATQQPTKPMERTVSDTVRDRLKDFDPTLDLIFFDYDETVADLEVVGQARKARSNGGIRDLFNLYRSEYSGRAFIFSLGNTFIEDHASTGIALMPSKHYPRFLHNTYTSFRLRDDNIDMLIFSISASSSIDAYYFPQFPAFFIRRMSEFNMKLIASFGLDNLGFNKKGLLKGAYLPFIIEKLGFNANNRVRRIYFIDDDANVIAGVSEAGEKLKQQGVATEGLIGIHVPPN